MSDGLPTGYRVAREKRRWQWYGPHRADQNTGCPRAGLFGCRSGVGYKTRQGAIDAARVHAFIY